MKLYQILKKFWERAPGSLSWGVFYNQQTPRCWVCAPPSVWPTSHHCIFLGYIIINFYSYFVLENNILSFPQRAYKHPLYDGRQLTVSCLPKIKYKTSTLFLLLVPMNLWYRWISSYFIDWCCKIILRFCMVL